MTYTSFKVDIEEYVAHVRFNRPDKSNALHREAWNEMKQIFSELDQSKEVRSIVLSGEGKHFCAGIDLSLLFSISQYEDISCEARKREELRKTIYYLQDCISEIERCRKPVLAAVHRACIGGAVDIISACDMRYCSSDAYFSIKEVDMGLVADIGTLQRLPKIIPYGYVAEMAYTGRPVNGAEAERIGLVNQNFDTQEELLAGVMEIAKLIASKSPLVIRGTKEIMQYTRDHSVEDSLRYMGTYNAAYLYSNDLNEAIQAQMTKRMPNFKD